jgi:RNA polymerase sigma-70 factor (ECF subfamily)
VISIGEALCADLDAGFTRLVESSQHRVYSLALSLTGNAADADDVAQDAFVRAYRALRGYDARRIRALALRPWLAKIALNVWRNKIRTKRHDGGPLDDEPFGDPRDTPEARVERTDSASRLRLAVASLPRNYRIAVVMRHAYDVPYAEAAAALGIPVGTLKSNVHRGTALLREELDRRTKAERR